MGKSNSKPWTVPEKSKLKGCAKIMCEKHGDKTCQQLPLWVKTFGFPENGSFSVRRIRLLQEELEDYEKKKGYGSVDWKEFRMWKQEAELRQGWQEKGRKKAPRKSSPSHPQKDLAPLPAPAPHPPVDPRREVRGQPTPAERTPPGRRSAPSPHPSAEDVLVGEQTTHATYKTINEPHLRESGAGVSKALTLDSEATRSPTTNGIKSIEGRDLRETGAGEMEVYRAWTQDSGTRRSQTTPVFRTGDGPNPRDIGAGAMEVYRPSSLQKTHNAIQIVQVPYAYGVWTPDEMRSFAKELPDVTKRGGAAFVKILSLIVQEFKPSLREIQSLLIHKLLLKFSKVKGNWLERDAPYDWTPGAGYRKHVEELYERIETAFPVRLKAICCKKQPDETVDNYLIRLTEVFEDNSGLVPAADPNMSLYESMLIYYFLQGLDEQIKDQAFKHSPFWETGRLSSVRAHAVHAEETLRVLEDKRKQDRVRLEERFMKVLIQLLQAENGWRNGGRGPSRGSRRHGCWNCGDLSHWKRDCDQSG
ncbi:uncharacterized protein LOC116704999 [Etheostoma spectabile]|uniref:CCHC-type domain-containing protein n=1 Tax=Etheostoma spectabile TaxID=54343 RepID=A0A5J5CRQ3_9PERO|nr:uncharacterized protein LOC116704999 [Etheostoma spectabile]KAA8583483.1 hypothetical protein FQN60_014691 [Etheostoma spectabile]